MYLVFRLILLFIVLAGIVEKLIVTQIYFLLSLGYNSVLTAK